MLSSDCVLCDAVFKACSVECIRVFIIFFFYFCFLKSTFLNTDVEIFKMLHCFYVKLKNRKINLFLYLRYMFSFCFNSSFFFSVLHVLLDWILFCITVLFIVFQIYFLYSLFCAVECIWELIIHFFRHLNPYSFPNIRKILSLHILLNNVEGIN